MTKHARVNCPIEQPNSQDSNRGENGGNERADRRNTIRRANNCLGWQKSRGQLHVLDRCSDSDLIFPIADKSFTCQHARGNSRQLRESIYFSCFRQVTGSRTRKGCSTLPASRLTHTHTHQRTTHLPSTKTRRFRSTSCL